jgi:hypothetical protein
MLDNVQVGVLICLIKLQLKASNRLGNVDVSIYLYNSKLEVVLQGA